MCEAASLHTTLPGEYRGRWRFPNVGFGLSGFRALVGKGIAI